MIEIENAMCKCKLRQHLDQGHFVTECYQMWQVIWNASYSSLDMEKMLWEFKVEYFD